MLTAEVQETAAPEIAPEAIREQLELLVQDNVFRSSRRSVQFLRYVVEQTIEGSADQIKERTIGVEVFGRSPSYDTNVDHVVRTAAIELRKRLAIYYGDERHRAELRMSLVPGSYIPRFTLPEPEAASSSPVEDTPHRPTLVEFPESAHPMHRPWPWLAAAAALLAVIALCAWSLRARNPQDLFWQPVVDTPGFVLLAVGDVPNGPPSFSTSDGGHDTTLPIVHKTSSPSVPFADAVTIARVTGALESRGKRVIIRPESASSFSELRESPVVLVGAFNNEWSLRLTRGLRYSLALDPAAHLVYIEDAKSPTQRTWSWATNQSTEHQGAAGGPPLEDYALISRIWNSETGRTVVVIGGLYTYGTQAAGEFLTDPALMAVVSKAVSLQDPHKNVQIVLGTTVTDGSAGPPRVLAVSAD